MDYKSVQSTTVTSYATASRTVIGGAISAINSKTKADGAGMATNSQRPMNNPHWRKAA